MGQCWFPSRLAVFVEWVSSDELGEVQREADVEGPGGTVRFIPQRGVNSALDHNPTGARTGLGQATALALSIRHELMLPVSGVSTNDILRRVVKSLQRPRPVRYAWGFSVAAYCCWRNGA